jgi:predicted RNA-binding protein YlqC (UPF0109 family)
VSTQPERGEQTDESYFRELLEDIVKSMVHEPDNVVVQSKSLGKSYTYVIQTAPRDTGIVIGKKGAHIDALRTIFAVISAASDVRIMITVDAPVRRTGDG